MSVITFDMNSKIIFEESTYIIKGYPAADEVLIKSVDQPYREKIVSVNDLSKESQNAKDVPAQLVDLNDKEFQKALEKYNIIEPLLKLTNRTAEDVEKIANEHKKGSATIYRWLSKYETYGTISSLSSLYKNSGAKGKGRLNPSVEAIIESVINGLYLNKQKYPFSTIYQTIINKCENINKSIPSENTVRNRINKLSPKLIAKRRMGVSVRDTRGTPGKFPNVKMPLDVIQIDHTKVDIQLVDEVTRDNIGRPNITVAIDVYSRMIYGFHISLEPINYFSVGQCLLQAILPKDDLLKQFKVEGEWPVYGLPRKIHMDNAKEFRSKSIQRFCSDYRIIDEYRPVARPEFGASVERVIKTHMEKVHQLPGSTFHNVTQKGTYDSEKEATMTIDELEKWFLDFIINIYHKTEHRSIGMTPEEKFYQGLYGVGDGTIPFLPSVPVNTIKLRMALLPATERKVQKNGITIDYITYFSETLRKWIIPTYYKSFDKKLKSVEVLCRRDPRDISKIYVYDPDIDDYIVVPYSDIKRPAINQTELRKAIAEAKKEVTGRELEMPDIFRAHERLNAYVERSKREKRSTRRHNSSKKHTQKAIEYEKELIKNNQSKINENQQSSANALDDDEDDFEYYPVDESL
jgi:putative transposase